jgi:hypothetical protein
MVVSLVLIIPAVLAVLYLLIWQTYVLRQITTSLCRHSVTSKTTTFKTCFILRKCRLEYYVPVWTLRTQIMEPHTTLFKSSSNLSLTYFEAVKSEPRASWFHQSA